MSESDLTEKTVSSKLIFDGVIVRLTVDRVLLPNGDSSTREVVEHPGGVAILPLEADGSVTLVSQYRYPLRREVLELPAGKLDGPEDPRPAALRELSEETGSVPEELIDLGTVYTSPGFSTEKLSLYLARGLRPGKAHPDPDEFLKLRKIPFARLVEMVLKNEIQDGKTVTAVLLAKAYLDRQA